MGDKNPFGSNSWLVFLCPWMAKYNINSNAGDLYKDRALQDIIRENGLEIENIQGYLRDSYSTNKDLFRFAKVADSVDRYGILIDIASLLTGVGALGINGVEELVEIGFKVPALKLLQERSPFYFYQIAVLEGISFTIPVIGDFADIPNFYIWAANGVIYDEAKAQILADYSTEKRNLIDEQLPEELTLYRDLKRNS